MQPFHFGVDPSLELLGLIEGALLLFLGRRLFWLFVAIVGFITVYSYFLHSMPGTAPLVRILIAVAAGVIGAILAVVLQRLAAALAGFFIGAYILASWYGVPPLQFTGPHGVELLIAGVICALIALWLLDPALIVLSCLAGSSLIVDALHLHGNVRMLVLVVLFAIGFVAQMRIGPARRRV
jgi:hypothetical protein